MKPSIRIHDIEQNKVIDREMTDAEYEVYLADQEQAEQEKANLIAKQADKAALLAKLGITAEEAALLLA